MILPKSFLPPIGRRLGVSMALLSNSFHEDKDLFSRQKIFFFMKKNIFFHEKKSPPTISRPLQGR